MNKTNSIIVTAALTIIVSLFALSFSVAPGGDVRQKVSDWQRAKIYTEEYLNSATDEAIGFKPTSEMRSFGQQMLHMAEANYGLAAAAAGKVSPVSFGQLEKNSDQYKTKEALTKAVMDSYDFVINSLKELDDSRMNETVKVFNFELTRSQALEKAFEHQTHHRGQTTVYLRLQGIKPPDEKLF